MKTRAAVFRKAGEPISMETIDVRSPGPHEVLVEFKATGLCHTDLSVVDGVLPWSAPVVLGHEGAGVVLETGPGVTRVTAGDHFISHSLPQCGHCPNCHSEKTNCCEELLNGNVLQRSGFSNGDETIGAYMGLGTFANFAILNEDQIAPINRDAPLDKVCTIGCALVTGVGSALYSAEVEPGSTVLVIGMGAIGLSAIQGARIAGAGRIIAVDTNDAKEVAARRVGATEFINPKRLQTDLATHIASITDRGADSAVRCGEPSGQTELHCAGHKHEQCALAGAAGELEGFRPIIKAEARHQARERLPRQPVILPRLLIQGEHVGGDR